MHLTQSKQGLLAMNILIIVLSFIPPKSIKADGRACSGAKCGCEVVIKSCYP